MVLYAFCKIHRQILVIFALDTTSSLLFCHMYFTLITLIPFFDIHID